MCSLHSVSLRNNDGDYFLAGMHLLRDIHYYKPPNNSMSYVLSFYFTVSLLRLSNLPKDLPYGSTDSTRAINLGAQGAENPQE